MAAGRSQRQKNSQTQSQRMGQWQIQSLNLLSMNAEDLREEIFRQVEKNPALEIVSDNFEDGLKSAHFKNSPEGNLRLSSASASGEEKSQAFQEILESRADGRKSLYSHLSEQLSALDLSASEKNLCKKIIGNLDTRGFYILSPLSLLDKKAGESPELLDKCLKIVQAFDPPGICVENAEKSLLLQARLDKACPRLALFFLDGHLDFLNPPEGEKILEKIRAFLKERKKLFFDNSDFSDLESASLLNVQEALDFIKGLNPFPASAFGQDEASYVIPDIYVEKGEGPSSFAIRVSGGALPKLRIAKDFFGAKKDSPFAASAVRQAENLLKSLEYRESAMSKAARAIVRRQIEFFKNGPGRLLPLRQKDIAQEIQVHESTVSRMASSKYLQCQWGIFPVSYFFTSSVDGKSMESVVYEIKKILEENSGKKISDQKISDALAARGIKVARRTVAKYRGQIKKFALFR